MSLARQAAAAGEVPVGAVIVNQGAVIGQGHNRTLTWNDPTAHAEVVALREAAKRVNNHRLTNCELFVSLEPCLMCSGAIFHARLARVTYAAADPKAGAAGSVMNVFQTPAWNHQTNVQGGLLAEEGGALLQTFFKARRSNPHRLREDALRTPANQLPPSVFASRYIQDLPSLQGLRLHYLDEGADPSDPRQSTWLALHTTRDWSHRFETVMPGLLAQGHRVVAPDLIGFGKSDKPKKQTLHTKAWHVQVLHEWIQRINANHLMLLLPDDGHGLGLTLKLMDPQRFLSVYPMPPSLPSMDLDMCAAPFPDVGHRAGPLALQKWQDSPQ